MKAILMDTYRAGDKIVAWLKTDDDIRLEFDYKVSIFLDKCKQAEEIIEKNQLNLKLVKRKEYTGKLKQVYELPVDRLSRYEKIVRWLELQSKHQLALYNADIAPEQMFLFENNIAPFDMVEVEENQIKKLNSDYHPQTSTLRLQVDAFNKIHRITANGKEYVGNEKQILKEFSQDFNKLNPDIILMNQAFSKLPLLYARMQLYKIECNFHRWDAKPILPKGGKSFFTYGKVIYRDYAIRLNGRFLVDEGSTIGAECDIEGILEISQLCGVRFQQVASRSFGAAFQAALVREMIRQKILVPFKEKPIDPPITMRDLLKFDRVGHRMDSLTGMHEEVAEIDFSSLFPWLIYNYNISPENFKDEEPSETIPGLPIKISLRKKGLVPTAIKPILDKRMYYKANPTLVSKARIQGLKWVLVTSYGYLRFREFKLGLATSHMAIGAYAREILIRAKEICEEKGFRVIHGIVDALYIQKKNILESEVREICKELEIEMGIPVGFEGIFKWIVFLPSINDDERPVPTKYYGLFENGEIKVRGIEARTTGSPNLVKTFQLAVLKEMSELGYTQAYERALLHLRLCLKNIKKISPYDLCCEVRISKTEYKQNNAQSQAVKLLQAKGYDLKPGHTVRFLHSENGVVLPEDYDGRPDIDKYKALLVRSLYSLYQPLGYKREDINEMTKNERQVGLEEYYPKPKISEIENKFVMVSNLNIKDH